MTRRPPWYLPWTGFGHGRTAGLLADPWQRWCIAVLALLALLVQLQAAWVAQVALLAVLLVLPGLLLLRALRVPGSAIVSFPAYVPCASLVVLMGSGLAVDLIGPVLGIAAPLRREPLLVGLEIGCLALLAAGAGAGPEARLPWAGIKDSVSAGWRPLAPLALPLLAAAGAARLNNSAGGAVAIVAAAACGLTLIGALVLASRLDKTLLSVLIYAASLALMWSFSLRGDLVYGFDISAEYHVMQQTAATGVWHIAHAGDAYGAMLSVTVLPAELHAVSGISGLLVFKAVYPALAALLPVMVFGLAARVLRTAWAVAAAVGVTAQEALFQQLPALARQEIALVLFAALIAAVLDDRLGRGSQLGLVALLGLGMAASHYSTTYFAAVVLVIAVVLQPAASWLNRSPPLSVPLAVALVAVAAGGVVWYGLLTKSTSNLSQVTNTVLHQGIDLLPSGGGGSLIHRYLHAGSSTGVSAAEYARQVHAFYAAQVPYVQPLPDAGNLAYALRDSTQAGPAVRTQLGLNALSDGTLIIQQLVNLVAAIGAIGMVASRRSTLVTRQAGLLGIAVLSLLAVLRVSGTAATAYNPERAFLQALVVLAISVTWALQWLAGKLRHETAVLAVVAAAIVVLFASTSGLAGVALGGGTTTNLADDGGDYQQFGMTSPELAAASWLGRAAAPGQLIYSDRYAQLRLTAVLGPRPAELSDVTPLTINQSGWIYADRTNVVDRTGLAYFSGESSSYAFPFGFLDANYDLVYANGSAEVYHR